MKVYKWFIIIGIGILFFGYNKISVISEDGTKQVTWDEWALITNQRLDKIEERLAKLEQAMQPVKIKPSGNKLTQKSPCISCQGEGEKACVKCDRSGSYESCGGCDGTGKESPGFQCRICKGRKAIQCIYCSGRGVMTCNACGGTGYKK